MSADPEFKKSETRFYVIIGVIVVLTLAGFFFWSIGGITGAGVYGEKTEANTLGATDEAGNVAESGGTSGKTLSTTTEAKEKGLATSKINPSEGSTTAANALQKLPGINLELFLSAYPFFKKETTIDQIEIEFQDLNTNININKERLELNSLQGIRLNLNGFAGKVYLTEQGLSLDGTVNKVEVNGVALSSEAMRVAFDGLNYRYLYLGGIDLNEVQFAGGAGKLVTKDEKVVYSLDSRDKIGLSQFWGDLTVDKNAEAPLLVKGEAQKLQISGDLELSLQ